MDGDYVLANIPIPAGFVDGAYNARSANARRYVDQMRQRLSLQALTSSLNALYNLPANVLWRLDCRQTPIGDRDLDVLARFDELEELVLTHTRVTDAGMRVLHTLQHLHLLEVAASAITDDAMVHIAALSKLDALDISDTGVTDDGLRALHAHPSLGYVNVRGAAIVGDGLAALTTAPRLHRVALTHRQYRHAEALAHARPEVELLY